MQSPAAPPRDDLSAEQVIGLLQDADGVLVDPGCELLNSALQVVDDVSGWLKGGTVSRNAYNTLHGTCAIAISTALDWGTAIIRPYMTLSDGVIAARFNLGAYYTSTPTESLQEDPRTYDVQGYDIIHALDDRVGESYSVAAGTDYLSAVEEILLARGYTQYIIDPSATGKTLPQSRSWALDDNVTWLTIVNDLLSAVGYAGVWSDWDGRLRCEAYVRPLDRGPEWIYTVDPRTSMMATGREITADYYDAPNRWVGVRSNILDGAAPTAGDGIFTYINEFYGPTSVAARGGRVITADILHLDVADQASLEAEVMRRVDDDLRLKKTQSVSTFPNPLHWHFDRIGVREDPSIPTVTEMLGTAWTLPLNGEDMQHEWSFL